VRPLAAAHEHVSSPFEVGHQLADLAGHTQYRATTRAGCQSQGSLRREPTVPSPLPTSPPAGKPARVQPKPRRTTSRTDPWPRPLPRRPLGVYRHEPALRIPNHAVPPQRSEGHRGCRGGKARTGRGAGVRTGASLAGIAPRDPMPTYCPPTHQIRSGFAENADPCPVTFSLRPAGDSGFRD
jgi:hypothetical protein